MGWYATLTEQVRYIIGDLDSSAYKYTDPQLGKFLGIAARFVTGELSEYEDAIVGPYSIDTTSVGDTIISPDPTRSGTPVGFANLLVAKSVSLIAHNELRKEGAAGGWKIVDDKSSIDGTAAVLNLKEVKRLSDDIYKETLEAFKRGEQSAGTVIFGPYKSANSPSNGYPGAWYGICRREC